MRGLFIVIAFSMAVAMQWPLAALSQTVGPCDTGAFLLHSDYPGARLSTCRVIGAHEVEVGIEPEDEGAINPSPWYGFHVRAQSTDAGAVQIRLKYQKHKHRYAPKVSVDGAAWRALPEADVEVSQDGSALLRLRPGRAGLYVSAQENLGVDFYAAWAEAVERGVPDTQGQLPAAQRQALDAQRRTWDAQWMEIGRSLGGRPIHALITNRDAAHYLLVVGRQHPPEVTGALALTQFVEELLKASVASCPGHPARCHFFQTHGLVVVPLLNPDGVAAGHWRHNLGQADLNRDWGPFTQPETRALKDLVDDLERRNRRPRMVLDFHSTRRNVFFTQDDRVPINSLGLVRHWLAAAKSRGGLYEFTHEPRGLDGSPVEPGQSYLLAPAVQPLPTSKNYFYARFGVPSITYEVADEEDRQAIAESTVVFAQGLLDVLSEDAAYATFSGCGDFFCHMVAVNRASLVMLAEGGLLPAEQAESIARSLALVAAEQGRAGAERWRNYLHLEARLVELAGTAAADLHMGRSRQDLHGTVRRMLVRQAWLEVFAALLEARLGLIELAEAAANIPMPAYTHGVQAQPTTFGHYLLAFSAGLGRDAERLMEGYRRLNLSALGAAALGTSGFPLNRGRLAALLGFDAPLENSYDANLVSTADYKLELANHLGLSAITIGQFVENLHTQYHDPQPWIRLDPGLTSGSTIMPQKRNPRPLDRLRSAASQVAGDAHTIALITHNTNTGMHDYRQIDPILSLAGRAQALYERYADLVSSIEIDAKRALEELGRGYSTMTEVADVLLREAGVPFREAHAYASALTDLGRATGRAATALSDRELRSVYERTMGARLPLSPQAIRDAMDPARLIRNRQGLGGPQPAEMERSIASHRAALAQAERWLMDSRGQLGSAHIELGEAYAALGQARQAQR